MDLGLYIAHTLLSCLGSSKLVTYNEVMVCFVGEGSHLCDCVGSVVLFFKDHIDGSVFSQGMIFETGRTAAVVVTIGTGTLLTCLDYITQ